MISIMFYVFRIFKDLRLESVEQNYKILLIFSKTVKATCNQDKNIEKVMKRNDTFWIKLCAVMSIFFY